MNDVDAAAKQVSDLIEFGTPKAEIAALMMIWLLVTGVAVLFFVLLTRETGFRREMRDAFRRKLVLMPARKALVFIIPLWLLLMGFNYNRTLGDRFFGIRQEVEGKQKTWVFVYTFPKRERRVLHEDIILWGGEDGWSRGMVRFSLEATLVDGRVLKSAFVPPHQFNDQGHRLNRLGADVALTSSE